jgi:tetratricopeptide (TPR) repeat protein
MKLDFPSSDTVVYRSPNLTVVKSPAGFHRSKLLIVTFAAITFNHQMHLPRRGQSRETFRGMGHDALHILPTGNHWYQYEDMAEMLASVSQVASGYNRLVTYGQSMGGYGVLHTTRALRPWRAIAVCPQTSIDPTKAKYHTGFERTAHELSFIRDDLMINGDPSVETVIAYDPQFQADNQHFRLARSHNLNLHGMTMPFSGHDVAASLRDTGLLKLAFAAFLEGDLREIRELRVKYRACRSNSQRYARARSHAVCARHLARGDLDRADQSASIAAYLDPCASTYRTWAEISEKRKDVVETARRWQKAVEDLGEKAGAYSYVRASMFLQKIGNFAEAEQIAAKGLKFTPNDFGLLRERADSLVKLKRFMDARRTLNILADTHGDRGQELRTDRIQKHPRLA